MSKYDIKIIISLSWGVFYCETQPTYTCHT